jgi:TonB family protein
VPPKSNGSNPQAIVALEVLTPSKGGDFNSYLYGLYVSVKDKWHASMPPSVQQGQRGVNAVQFRVLQDGRVSDDFLKLQASSCKKDFDKASLGAVRKAAPFNHLPRTFLSRSCSERVTAVS